jgi:hypothetical protein
LVKFALKGDIDEAKDTVVGLEVGGGGEDDGAGEVILCCEGACGKNVGEGHKFIPAASLIIAR